MGKRTRQEIEAFASEILVKYFCECDVEFLISTFADDIIWLGAGEKQKAEGKEAVAAWFLAGKDELSPCDMFEEQYETLEIADGCYLCEGVSWLQSRKDTQLLLRTQQRVTFVFRENANRLEVVHIHNSAPFTALQNDELFPVEAAREAYRNLKNALLQKNQEFERQAQFLSQLYNSVPCGIIQFTTDESHEIINVNRTVWTFYGFSSEEEYRKEVRSPLQMVPAEDQERIKGIIDSLSLNGETVAYTRKGFRKSGAEVWISVVMEKIRNTAGQEVIQAVFTDITEIKRMEMEQEREQLMENRSLRAAICTAYPLIMSINLTKNTYNCFIEDQVPYSFRPRGSYTELVKKSLPLVHPSSREEFAAVFAREEILRRFADGEREIFMELQEKWIDGAYHWITVHVIYVENPFNQDVLAINLVKGTDKQRIERTRQEQLLRDALASAKEANRAKSDFLSRMSHDIRTPINAIIGMSAIGQLKQDDPGALQDCFRKIDTSSQFLLSIINDILDMSKIEAGKIELAQKQFDFIELLREINQITFPQMQEHRLSYEIYCREPLERYYIGDSLRIKQILMNLLSNALKFTPPGGEIRIEIRETQRCGSVSQIQFRIRDTGIGMSAEFQRKIFRPFEQETPEGARNNVGSGLGLSIVYNLVQLMGGNIGVTSKKNEGTLFTVTLPFRRVSDRDESEKNKKEASAFKDLNILIADSDPVVREQVPAMLEEAGARTDLASSGKEAVAKTEDAVHAGHFYDIILIGRQMPDQDGIETARLIRRIAGPNPMLAMITAYGRNSIEPEAPEAGISCFLSKPIFRTEIRDAYDTFRQKMPAEKEPQQVRSDFIHCNVLLVEDNELNREIAQTVLELHGISVTAAANGKEAVACFRQYPPDYFTAILMDIRMPVMDGLQATREIRGFAREDAARVPILAMTANAFEEDKALAYKAGMSGYLIKPLDVGTLLNELKKFL